MARPKKPALTARDALLHAMKAAVPANPVARADFRDDVMWLCSQWRSGPLCWFASKEGTAIVELPPNLTRLQVKNLGVRLNRLTSIIGCLFVVEDDQLIETNLQELLAALEEYYA